MTDPIRTPRLSLELLRPPAIRRLLDGDREAAGRELGIESAEAFVGERLYWLRRHLSLQERYPDRAGWCARLAVLASARVAVGHCGFHGPPEAAGRAEIGYTIFEPHRRQGYAREAAAGLVGWAFEQGEREVFASVSPGNEASLAIVRGLGFRQVGAQEDPVDGTELVFSVEPAGFAGG